MRADGNPRGTGRADRRAHRVGIAGMGAARDVDRGDVRHHPPVVLDRAGADCLAEVAVQIDPHAVFLQIDSHQ
jgi:hypothetical protein